MTRLVMKFGGSILKSGPRIRKMLDIIRSEIAQNPVVVVSAFYKVTDRLIEVATLAKDKLQWKDKLRDIWQYEDTLIKELKVEPSVLSNLRADVEKLLKEVEKSRELSAMMMDSIISYGEMASTVVLADYFVKQDVKASKLFGWEAGIETDDHFGNAVVNKHSFGIIRDKIGDKKGVTVVSGFIAKSSNGLVTTLGRNGSDLTATIVAAAINAPEVQIWKDVDGVMTCDPNLISETRSVREMSYGEAQELSTFGAQVLHPRTIEPVRKHNVPIRVRNFEDISQSGTIIRDTKSDVTRVAALACKHKITMVHIRSPEMVMVHGFLAKVFGIFDMAGISIDLVSTSEVSITVTLDNTDNLNKAVDELKHFCDVVVQKDMAVIAVVGENIRDNSVILGQTLQRLSEENIRIAMVSWGASALNLSIVVCNKDVTQALKLLHEIHFECGGRPCK